jgi:hypothetical protein
LYLQLKLSPAQTKEHNNNIYHLKTRAYYASKHINDMETKKINSNLKKYSVLPKNASAKQKKNYACQKQRFSFMLLTIKTDSLKKHLQFTLDNPYLDPNNKCITSEIAKLKEQIAQSDKQINEMRITTIKNQLDTLNKMVLQEDIFSSEKQHI